MSTLVLCTCTSELNLLLKNTRISNDGIFAVYGLNRENLNIGPTCILIDEMHQIASLPFEVQQIVFVGSPNVDQFREAIFQTLNHSVSSIYVFHENKLTPIFDHYSNRKIARKKTFLIYPGKLLPIRNGSAMRCFDIAVSLSTKTDLTIFIVRYGYHFPKLPYKSESKNKKQNTNISLKVYSPKRRLYTNLYSSLSVQDVRYGCSFYKRYGS
jgi:hypothetical protein